LKAAGPLLLDRARVHRARSLSNYDRFPLWNGSRMDLDMALDWMFIKETATPAADLQ
jgi:hypothetical protein